eukprot:CAMPEP_0206270806 /NCGR_PEP_ID=MMETSP0047_2-20121206/33071_1 /ASSEMBLY_ACC=CAM_ASM_000192 /TAXON_ID=195065 /ORGANISM="Chroomonas mesostigmatica_cf, Strain CCMP1168" /LENGTH=73 /DNA_ID=CAMNT_0053699485 /DNA_START=102 /DNA_END=320 /DNA_ORIENTATION=+
MGSVSALCRAGMYLGKGPGYAAAPMSDVLAQLRANSSTLVDLSLRAKLATLQQQEDLPSLCTALQANSTLRSL